MNFTVASSDLKMETIIQGSLDKELKLRIVFQLLFQPSLSASPRISSSNSLVRIEATSPRMKTFIRLIKFVIVDNSTIQPIDFQLRDLNNTSQLGSLYEMTLEFPSFQSSISYDPDFSVILKNDNDNNDKNDNNDTNTDDYIYLLVLVIVPVAGCITAIASTAACLRRRQKLRQFKRESLHVINTGL